jgi:hypothetical protein
MLFNIEQDLGDLLIFYIVPDDYSSVPRCRIESGNQILGFFDANEERAALVSAGRHETGMCGFRISTSDIPSLPDLASISIFDDQTGLKIYCRPNEQNRSNRLLRLETHLLPLWRFDKCLAPFFQYCETGIDQYGRETSTQMFLLDSYRSIYLSGRIFYRNYAYYIEKGFNVFTILQSPHMEMAERLRVLALNGKFADKHLGDRDKGRFAPAIEFASSLSFLNQEHLLRRLRQMPEDVEFLLAEPLTRQLTCGTPDDMPTKGAVAVALDVLSNCLVIGLRDRSLDFVEAISELLEIPPGHKLAETVPIFDSVQPLAALLQETRLLDHLIDLDLEIYSQVKLAYSSAG